MTIDASLFAHIHNDAFLSGTVKLEGNFFRNTITYLNAYCDHLMEEKKQIPESYLKLFENLKYLKDIEEKLGQCKSDAETQPIAQEIARDILQGKNVIIPGGWLNSEAGHAMIYQFSQSGSADGYVFTVFNSGDGIRYHAKKSIHDKNLYNPRKMWFIPHLETLKEQKELEHFIGGLLQARISATAHNKKENVNTKILYEKILPSISYVDGKEINADEGSHSYDYTGGQLSGTCTQRSIHQMLKINSDTLKSYQDFIFKFKMYSLKEYANACLNDQQPFNRGVADQINLAVNNSLKMLNIPDLFTSTEVTGYVEQLKAIKKSVENKLTSYKNMEKDTEKVEHIPQLKITTNPLVAFEKEIIDLGSYSEKLTRVEDCQCDDPLSLEHLSATIKAIQEVNDPAVQYVYLEQLILSLPLNENGTFSDEIYHNLLKNVDDYEVFLNEMNKLQQILTRLRHNWIKNKQIPLFNHLSLSILSLQIDTYEAITDYSREEAHVKGTKGLPSFIPLGNLIMQTLIAKRNRDPFEATNHSDADQRILLLKKRFQKIPLFSDSKMLSLEHYKDIMSTQPDLNADLIKLYNEFFSHESSEIHQYIRTYDAQSLFMITLHLQNKRTLDPKFEPLINKIKDHYDYELELYQAINPYYKETKNKPLLIFKKDEIVSPIMASELIFGNLQTPTKDKYNLEDSPACNALKTDTITDYASSRTFSLSKTANAIQLQLDGEEYNPKKIQNISTADILARDYYHLRSNPVMQIALTIDYFTLHISKLQNPNNQRYVEANLFQPGLLADALKKEFMPQFDNFLTTGKRFFAQKGQHTRESLQFFRLDWLVSSYYAQSFPKEGAKRLQNMQNDLIKQLSLSVDPDVIYVLQQYLFLTTVERIKTGDISADLLEQGIKSYFYIMRHANPSILEDTTHRIEVERAIGQFKIFISKQPDDEIKNQVKKALLALEILPKDEPVGNFPTYKISVEQDQELTVDVLKGMVFQKGMIKMGLPIAIQHHPLMKQLNLHHVRTCLANAKGTYFVISCKTGDVHLFYKDNRLAIQKDWTVGEKTSRYELQALTNKHEAYYANKARKPIITDLPAVLTDSSMNYWQRTTPSDDKEIGILVRNNIPAYVHSENQIKSIFEEEIKKSYQLTTLEPETHQIFNAFEGNRFIVAYTEEETKNAFVRLPRFGLHFKIDSTKKIINEATGEEVIPTGASAIHPSVSGLALQGIDGQHRILVPKMRFYGLTEGVPSHFYPVAHDNSNMIAEHFLEQKWGEQKPVKEPLWDYQGSERYASFQFINGEPIADSSADALYLAYMYLVTNQPDKAWNILEECTKRLGGLKGDAEELRYIQWICNDLPYLFDKENKTPLRSTPPFVACKLKAMSLLSDYLLQDGSFDLRAPNDSEHNANFVYAQHQHKEATDFLKTLPDTIYNTFERYQKMERHLDYQYQLSKIERKCLLNYYHQSLPLESKPLGALGYQWTKLSLEALLEEKNFLEAQRELHHLSGAEQKRLAYIQKQLNHLKDISSISTQLKLIPIDLSLPTAFAMTAPILKQLDQDIMQDNIGHIGIETLKEAVKRLSSSMSDDEFIQYFPAYLQIAATHKEGDLRKDLFDFCTRTLIAKRHVSHVQQNSVIPFLCNVLYRVAENQTRFDLTQYNKKSFSEPFKYLVRDVEKYTVPPLQVYQAQDIYSDVLASPQELIDTYQHQKHQSISTLLSDKPSHVTRVIDQLLPTSDQNALKKDFYKFVTDYQQIQNDMNKTLGSLGKDLSHGGQNEFDIEMRAGEALIHAENKRKQLAEQLLQNKMLMDALQKSAFEASIQLELETKKFWAEALKIANQGPENVKSAQNWNIEKESQARAILTKADLLSIYTKADQAYSISKTGLNSENAQKLHDTIHQALVHGILYQSAKKIETKLDEKNIGSATIALDLLARSEIPALNVPAMVLLQHEEQILLHNRQANALKELLTPSKDGDGFNEVVEKIIMGGGKSKVILPILSEKKAQGSNLVIVEVPQALLETNHEDLNRTSQRLYGKRAYRFDFNRDSHASPERLEQIYTMFVDVMTNKNYLVTTGEAIQSLELKYIELLETRGPLDTILEQQIYWMDKITSLIRHHGDCIIDEAHQGLSIKKRLNYTGTDAQTVRPETVKNTVVLFQLINPELLAEAPNFKQDHDWTPFKKELARALFENHMSPLYDFANNAAEKYGKGIQEQLVDYLINQTEQSCQAINEASKVEKEMLGFFKQEVSVLLPQTLVRHLDEHYGASKRIDLNGIEQTLALPYAANNVVNERSRFGNQLESLNYTAQMMLIRGISQQLLRQILEQWMVVARKELFENPKLEHLDQTPTAKGFQQVSSGMKLSDINLDNAGYMQQLHHYFQSNQEARQQLIFNILQEQALRQVQQEGETISSNSFNHVDMYRSTQAISGTPSNHTTYHQRMTYKKECSLGTDGYLIETIHHKNTAIHSLSYKDVTQFVQHLLADSDTRTVSDRTRAIIDICAMFQGVSNEDVAKGIADFYRRKSNNIIKHVLYFDNNQILCAIDINKPNEPIVLKTTDEKEISRLLGSFPTQRFTYYDQSHTVGTDIKQTDQAHALVLANEKTSLQAFLQGSMRMRGLALDQTMEIIVPETMNGIERNKLVEQFEKNDRLTLVNDNLTAAKLQMSNLIRRQCLEIIRNLPSEDVEHKRQLAQHFEPFLIDKPSDSFFELYGSLNKKQATSDILKTYKEDLIKRWEVCVALAKLPEDKTIDAGLQTIIEKSLPNCLEEYEAAQNGNFATEVQIQTEIQREIELEVALIHETFDPKLSEAPIIGLESTEEHKMNNYSLPLNTVCSPNKLIDLFSHSLRASKNYALTYDNQSQYTGGFLKPAWVTWYYMHDKTLSALIITPQEAENLMRYMQSESLKISWFSSSLDTVLGGERPEGMLNDEQYLSLREQVRFFNGEIPNLLNQHRFSWLNEFTSEKLELFKKELMPYRPESSEHLPQLHALFLEGNKSGFIHIAKNRFEDLRQLDWEKQFSNTIPAQAHEYRRVADAFYYINTHWNTKKLDIKEVQKKFNLSLIGLGYVQEHLEKLEGLLNRTIEHVLTPTHENATFIDNLSFEETHFLERCLLNMPFKEFTKKAVFEIDFNTLCLINEHSALNEMVKQNLIEFILNDPRCDGSILNTSINDNKLWTSKQLLILSKKCTDEQDLESLLNKALENKDFLKTNPTNHEDIKLLESLVEKITNPSTLSTIVRLAYAAGQPYYPDLTQYLLQKEDFAKAILPMLLKSLHTQELIIALLKSNLFSLTQPEQIKSLFEGAVKCKAFLNIQQDGGLGADLLKQLTQKMQALSGIHKQEALPEWDEEDLHLVDFLLKIGIDFERLTVLFTNWDVVREFVKWAKDEKWDGEYIRLFLFDKTNQLRQWSTRGFESMHQGLNLKNDVIKIDRAQASHGTLKEFQQIFDHLKAMGKIEKDLVSLVCFFPEIRHFFINKIRDNESLGIDTLFKFLNVNCKQLKEYLDFNVLANLEDPHSNTLERFFKLVTHHSFSEQTIHALFEDTEFVQLIENNKLLNYFTFTSPVKQDFVQFLVKNKDIIKIKKTGKDNESIAVFVLKFILKNEKIDKINQFQKENKRISLEKKDIQFVLEFISDSTGDFSSIVDLLLNTSINDNKLWTSKQLLILSKKCTDEQNLESLLDKALENKDFLKTNPTNYEDIKLLESLVEKITNPSTLRTIVRLAYAAGQPYYPDLTQYLLQKEDFAKAILPTLLKSLHTQELIIALLKSNLFSLTQPEQIKSLFEGAVKCKAFLNIQQDGGLGADLLKQLTQKMQALSGIHKQEALPEWDEEDLHLVDFLLKIGIDFERLTVLFTNWDVVREFVKWAKDEKWDGEYIRLFLFDKTNQLRQWNTRGFESMHQGLNLKNDVIKIDEAQASHGTLKEFQQIFDHLKAMGKIEKDLVSLVCFFPEIRHFFINKIRDNESLGIDPLFKFLNVNCKQLKEYLDFNVLANLEDPHSNTLERFFKFVTHHSFSEQTIHALFEDTEFVQLIENNKLLNYFTFTNPIKQDFVQFLVKNKDIVKIKKDVFNRIGVPEEDNEYAVIFALKFILENEKIDKINQSQKEDKRISLEKEDIQFVLEFISDPTGDFSSIVDSLKEQFFIKGDEPHAFFINALLTPGSPQLTIKQLFILSEKINDGEQIRLLCAKAIRDNVFSERNLESTELLVLLAQKRVGPELANPGYDYPSLKNPNNAFWNQLIYIAAENSDSMLFELLKAWGVNLSQTRGDGETLAHVAAENNCTEILQLLASEGSELFAKEMQIEQPSGMAITPAFVAAYYGHKNVIITLKELGADLSKTSPLGHTLAYIVAQTGKDDVLTALYDLGLSDQFFNQFANNGLTPALIAAKLGHDNILIKLNEIGADLNIKNPNNDATATFYAALHNNLNVLKALDRLDALDFKSMFKADNAESLMAWFDTVCNQYENDDPCEVKRVAAEIKERLNNKIAEFSQEQVIYLSPYDIAIIMGHDHIVKYIDDKLFSKENKATEKTLGIATNRNSIFCNSENTAEQIKNPTHPLSKP